VITARSIGMAIGALFFVTVAHGQVPQVGSAMGVVGMGGGQSPVAILLSPAVQTELKLTDEQKSEIYTLARESSERGREVMRDALFQNGDLMQMRNAGMDLRKSNDRAIAKLLKPKQKARFDQIVLRYDGPLAAARPEIAEKLNITKTQNQKIQLVIQDMMRTQYQMVVMMRQSGTYTSRMRSSITTESAKLRETAGQHISKVLSRKQKDTFNAMLGEPFDLSKIDPDRISPSDAETKKSFDAPEPDKSTKSARKKKRV
jgi:hypothetical protein